MPSPKRHLKLADARTLIGSCGFGPPGAGSHRTVGVELESFTSPATHPDRLPVVPLPAGSRLTYEPGGQVELSSRPQMTVASACDSLSADLAALSVAFSPLGIGLRQHGLAPAAGATEPPRVVNGPRYQAMEAYFDSEWREAGRTMMRATASVQVNLGLGTGTRASRRWRAATVLGPVLAAAFSSSQTGSPRLANWFALDPSRTAPVPSGEPRQQWADYALDARVMFIRSDETYQPIVEAPLTARAWVEHGHPLGWPTADDLAYHLTTLFPPVRPRGWLELRMIDALPDPWWRVPVAVAAVLIDDPQAVAGCQPAADRWGQAAAEGLTDPVLAAAAAICARRALTGQGRVGVDMGTAVLVEQWAATVRKGCEPPWI
jgi:glutamate--cysteine ligase